jgi:small-conductance mechanosensitive channel
VSRGLPGHPSIFEHALPNISLIPRPKNQMRNAVLELITSYENTISSVEELITASYSATVASDDGLDELAGEREKLTQNLQEALAKNCSLRRKDFNSLMERMLSTSEQKRREIEDERRLAGNMLRSFLEEQKELVASARERLIRFTQEGGNRNSLEAIISELKAVTQEKGERVFSQLRCYQWRLDVFRREQEEINRNLQRLLDRGTFLKFEDIRHLEAASDRQKRRACTEMRREDVERLLAHYSQQRRWRRRRSA